MKKPPSMAAYSYVGESGYSICQFELIIGRANDSALNDSCIDFDADLYV